MRLPKAPLVAALLLGCLAGCTSSGGGSHKVSVFSVKPGQCFTAPGTVKVQLSSLAEVDCSKPHTQEAYAVVPYAATGAAASTGSSAARALTSSYPGEDVLTTFAQGTCAQRYRGYVGVDYLDSKLFFTYLLPSARSWEQQADRNVLCFVTTTGTMLTKSVKGTKQ